ncbi:hypothetical protein [Arthrobacter sp. D5-1]|uniref:hypothetical protein n=1 Tax=Arthrobacter sp. D5-1 TaxID=1477518 RepID=UPI001A99E59A|nr:hypothetical protein [Arthrobacter sp. D5-1]QSZ49388.1 hypothetical protein AYX22_13945 [Arthrobacter sp. D5-1]
MIRKEGKARWVFECLPCGYVSPVVPDLLRAKECNLSHNRGNLLKHFGQTFAEAFMPFVELVQTLAKADHFQDDYTLVPPPKNVPHDPSLLMDRRKWGGR